MASLGWWRGYKSRFPTLSVRSIQPHSFARARATQPEIINHFYDLLKQQLDAHGFEPHQIYAADETGVAGEIKPGKGVGDKGAYATAQYCVFLCCIHANTAFQNFFFFFFFVGKKLETVVLSVRGHVSIMHICNANGVSLPPLYVFSGCQLVHNMLDGAPPGTIHTYKNTKTSRYFC